MIKVLMLRKKIDLKKKEMDALREKQADIEKREAELETAVAEVTNEEEQATVEESVNALAAERDANNEAMATLGNAINELENELAAMERAQETEPEQRDNAPAKEERSEKTMNRNKVIPMTLRERMAEIVTRDDVKAYLGEVRTAIREKRALTNVGLTIPEVFLGYLRENLENYSKLYKHVDVRSVGGEARIVIAGTQQEAIWTECCANINELDMAFYGMEMDCYKVAGSYVICNATLEDSDLNLAAEMVTAIGKGIGLALDKAILFGRNTAAAMKMPMGIVTRLVQTEQPSGYPAQARPWVDLHTSNVKTIANTETGLALFQALVIAEGAAKNKFARGGKVHVMNENTLTYLKAQGMSVNAAGAIVTGMEGTMPLIGGVVETLEFIPDYIIISGYFDNFVLLERAGKKFASSEHVRFLQDQTVFKGTARYDGAPAIAEAFVVIGINGAEIDATDITFGEDKANQVNAIAINTATASVAVGAKKQLFAIVGPGAGEVEWTSAATAKATVDDNGVVTGVASGSAVITATCNGLTANCTVTVTTA